MRTPKQKPQESKNQEDLGHLFIQYCWELINSFEIDICCVLIPESNTLLKKTLIKVSVNEETIFNYIFLPPSGLPWKWRPGKNKISEKGNIIILSDMEKNHPYKDPIQYLIKCALRAMVIVPLCLNKEVIGYILLINEKTPRTFTKTEKDRLQERTNSFLTAIKETIFLEEAALAAKIISEIEGYKTFLDQKGARKNPEAIIQIFLQSGIHTRRILLVNKDPHLGNMWYHAVINAAGATEVNEMGTISESGFDFFIKELVIKDRRSICVPIKTGDNLKGKLAIKYSQIDNDRAVKDNMTRILETIAPHLAELMYL